MLSRNYSTGFISDKPIITPMIGFSKDLLLFPTFQPSLSPSHIQSYVPIFETVGIRRSPPGLFTYQPPPPLKPFKIQGITVAYL